MGQHVNCRDILRFLQSHGYLIYSGRIRVKNNNLRVLTQFGNEHFFIAYSVVNEEYLLNYLALFTRCH